MSKAFDSINHNILLLRLKNYCFHLSTIDWFRSYLACRNQVVQIGNVTSERQSVVCGVPQGTILSPILFTLYINDLLSVPKQCQVMGYVDDTKLFLSVPSKEISEGIQAINSDLKEVVQWCCANHLLLNPIKTKALAIGVPQCLKNLQPISVSMLGKDIEVIPATKDLGVIIDKHLNFNEHITQTASNCFYRLNRINRIKHLLDIKTLMLTISTLVFVKTNKTYKFLD